jgi:hypothetical protein
MRPKSTTNAAKSKKENAFNTKGRKIETKSKDKAAAVIGGMINAKERRSKGAGAMRR